MKKLSFKIIGAILIAILILQYNIVIATSTTDLKSEQNENNKKINETQYN